MWALAEVGAKVHLVKGNPIAQEVVDRMNRDAAEVHPVSLEDVRRAIALRTELRRSSGSKASLGDAVLLAQARRLGVPFISGDPAFRGQRDVSAGGPEE